jgi:hypothetical protein
LQRHRLRARVVNTDPDGDEYGYTHRDRAAGPDLHAHLDRDTHEHSDTGIDTRLYSGERHAGTEWHKHQCPLRERGRGA